MGLRLPRWQVCFLEAGVQVLPPHVLIHEAKEVVAPIQAEVVRFGPSVGFRVHPRHMRAVEDGAHGRMCPIGAATHHSPNPGTRYAVVQLDEQEQECCRKRAHRRVALPFRSVVAVQVAVGSHISVIRVDVGVAQRLGPRGVVLTWMAAVVP
jgi:hypothetical protein